MRNPESKIRLHVLLVIKKDLYDADFQFRDIRNFLKMRGYFYKGKEYLEESLIPLIRSFVRSQVIIRKPFLGKSYSNYLYSVGKNFDGYYNWYMNVRPRILEMMKSESSEIEPDEHSLEF